MPGKNDIRRKSIDSNVTLPYERSFRAIGEKYGLKDGRELDEYQFCGCGWPHHMLVPKSTYEGTVFELFVMITDYNDDSVNEEPNMYVY